ncbi:MAG: hypothetical protein A2802_00495 [Candidatus Woykebacteria bacterium RIFCSPHIGHO2_01_FULL_43_29]|uniref:Uncharacterized protein n=2 Tax=Candidatus Woykeibacteriota TaxID=1817899 RepID=A0A1G1WUV6_9BACT|nr:MAG: hypothetical protein A2802_00495 [Candidatus Woykebacteria bacterium RIFCSPHIGHO2_01_FULL_43_29]OGY28825.1 MAG: hypothetical protein A3J50_02385 [Candidatus Woykebacteria bacterium RIFCSPHIGHO2_02_FULL_43_16b]OGY31549.1 MAG: hypothetical protein A3A61_03525 [Candidatus Woykebacteria bacterium RIFCSPLOWO2_01_FULL_43_14]
MNGPPRSRAYPLKILGFLGLGLLILIGTAFLTDFLKKPAASLPLAQVRPTQIPEVVTAPEPKCDEPTYRLNGWEHEGYLDDNPVMFPFQGTPNWLTVELVCDGETVSTEGNLEILDTSGGTLFEEIIAPGKTFQVKTGNTPEFPGLFGFKFQLVEGFHDLVLRVNGQGWPIKFQTRNNVLDWGSVVASDQAPSTTSEVKQVLLNNERAKYALNKIAGITDTSKCRVAQRRNTVEFEMLWMDANLVIGVQEKVPAGKWVWLVVCEVEEGNQVVEKTIPINPDCFNPQGLPPGKGPGGPVATPVRPGVVVTPTIVVRIYSESPTPEPTATAPLPPTERPGITIVVVTPSTTPAPPPTTAPVTGTITIVKWHHDFYSSPRLPEAGAKLEVLDASCSTVLQSKNSGAILPFVVTPGTYCARVVFAREKGDPILKTELGQTVTYTNGSVIVTQRVTVAAGQVVAVEFDNVSRVAIQEVASPSPVPVAPAASTQTLAPVISPTPMPATPTFHFQLATIPPPTTTPGPTFTPCCVATPQFSPAPTFVPSVAASYTAIWTPQPTPTRPPLPPTPVQTTPTMVSTAVLPTSTPAPNATAGPKPTNTSFAG